MTSIQREIIQKVINSEGSTIVKMINGTPAIHSEKYIHNKNKDGEPYIAALNEHSIAVGDLIYDKNQNLYMEIIKVEPQYLSDEFIQIKCYYKITTETKSVQPEINIDLFPNIKLSKENQHYFLLANELLNELPQLAESNESYDQFFGQIADQYPERSQEIKYLLDLLKVNYNLLSFSEEKFYSGINTKEELISWKITVNNMIKIIRKLKN